MCIKNPHKFGGTVTAKFLNESMRQLDLTDADKEVEKTSERPYRKGMTLPIIHSYCAKLAKGKWDENIKEDIVYIDENDVNNFIIKMLIWQS